VLKSTTRLDLDIGDADAVNAVVAEFAPTLILNAAAYTAVDAAETERDTAWRVNSRGPALLAEAAGRIAGCQLMHVSTDYVFSGDSSRPYRPDDQPAPIGAYGQSKLEGERAVQQILGPRALVLRTAWVYGPHGRNFVLTMLRLMRERGSVRVVADQIGCPTATVSLARALWLMAQRTIPCGIYHWSDAGAASWYDFAVAVAEEGRAAGLLPAGIAVVPIGTDEYPTPARRPRYSLLDIRSTAALLAEYPVHWRVRLRQVLDEIKHG
jgi:dTDP-4-dehydrorhamnose reductase